MRWLIIFIIDSGAMYRCVTLYILQNNISPDNDAAIIATLPNINIHFTHINGQIETYLNGQNVEKQIREDKQIANHVSTVAAIPAVRQFLVKQQQQLGINKGIIMDGRDIGTVVFPDAELKIFLTAKPEIRAQRRYNELMAKGVANITYQEVLANLIHRDNIDSTRETTPLRCAPGAQLIDNSNLNKEEQLAIAIDLAMSAISKLPDE